MMSRLLAVLFMIYLLMDYTSARTCTCAQFLPMECNGEIICQWNNITYGRGNHGICRSNKWMDCHHDPDCRARPMDNIYPPQEEEQYELEFIDDTTTGGSGGSGGAGGQAGGSAADHVPSATDDKDWPYDCKSMTYYDDAIDVTAMDEAAYRMTQKMLNRYSVQSVQELVELGNHTPIIKDSFHYNNYSIISALSVIIFVVAGLGYCYRHRTKGGGYKLLNSNGFDNYSTV